jgi:Skp family chaperone for outer membrane proteins
MNANVMKRVVGFAAAVFFAMAAQAQTKTAVVDLKKVFDGYWRTKQAPKTAPLCFTQLVLYRESFL